MARYVIKNKVYDTSKMQLVGNVKKFYKFTGYWERQIFGEDTGRIYDCYIARTKEIGY